eukprot:TRINITY_DN12479_c0_g1_i1.p2 TRINITY_DN12479_c0_g1~~TRINITY_DN12479_c0_g1_i1.p2  ORF type:complete len:148 (+),score=13.28 TRINITY_DN12479_c0_g1_i1:32-475(+)
MNTDWDTYFTKLKVVEVRLTKGESLEDLIKNASEYSNETTKKFHFSVDQNAIEMLSLNQGVKQEFFEFVHDTTNLDLLNRGCWLTRRDSYDTTDSNWSLKWVRRVDNLKLEILEIENPTKERILQVIRIITKSSSSSIIGCCPCIVS